MAATDVKTLIIEAMRNTVSVDIFGAAFMPRSPNAPW
jgi:hypothetical protein